MCLLCKHGDLSSNPQHPLTHPGIAIPFASPLEAGGVIGGSLGLLAVGLTTGSERNLVFRE